MPLRAFVTYVIMTVDNNARYPIKICGLTDIWHCYPQTVQAEPSFIIRRVRTLSAAVDNTVIRMFVSSFAA